MALNVKLAFVILGLLFGMMVIAGVALMVNVLLYGIGDSMADNLGVNTSTPYTSSVTMQRSAVSTSSTIMTFLPWLGVGLAIIGAIGIGGILNYAKTRV